MNRGVRTRARREPGGTPGRQAEACPTNSAREKFAERIRDWAARLEVRVRAVSIRKMRNKWASCSTAGRLTFDKSLLTKPGKLQDYVIVHELLHVRVPNHGKLWKSLMRAYLGDYEVYEERLKMKA